jgi:hypothetical protein
MVSFLKCCSSCRAINLAAFESDHAKRICENKELARKNWMNDANRGIPARYRSNVWGNFEYTKGGGGNRAKVIKMHDYAELMPVDVIPKGWPSMLIARDLNGVGKTMLASLIVKTLTERCDLTDRERCPFQFWTVSRIKQRLKAAEGYGRAETVEDVYRDLTMMWLLVMDDVGKERLDGADVAYTYEMYYHIINERYNNELPIIITSNLKFEPWREGGISLVDLMGRAACDRLGEMVGPNRFVIEGEGWR